MHYPELWFKGISNHIQDWRRLAREARRNAQQLTKPYSVIKILLFRCAIFTLPFSLTVDIHAMLWVISLLPHLLCIVSFCLSRNVTLAWWLICHHYFRDCLLNCSCFLFASLAGLASFQLQRWANLMVKDNSKLYSFLFVAKCVIS